MVIAEVRIYSANSKVGDWATGGTLAAYETGCLVIASKGDIARRTMSVCTQQCMAVFRVRKRYTTYDM